MQIQLTAAAADAIRKAFASAPSSTAVRITARLDGTCSAHLDVFLVLDQPRQQDFQVQVEDILFSVDPDSISHLGKSVKVSYSPTLAFQISTPEEILAYHVKLKHNSLHAGHPMP